MYTDNFRVYVYSLLCRAKSMVAGLEGGSGSIEKDDDDLNDVTKSNSVESLHQQSLSSASTPTQGTPVQLRTASIKQRPTSSRITAAELVELFQRQTGELMTLHKKNILQLW